MPMRVTLKTILTVYLIGISFSIFSQDVIILKNGDEVKAFVQEVELEAIKYKKFENQIGPTYIVTKSEVFMIKYQNGTKDVFQVEDQTKDDEIRQQTAFRKETNKNDIIFLLSGKQIGCNITNITEFGIMYSFVGESLTNTIAKKQVKEIHFGSGRIQKFSELIIINGENDWEKVQLTTLQTDIDGLVRMGEVMGKATGAYATNVNRLKERAERKMKMEAAKLGAHIILIQSYNVLNPDLQRINISGVAYGYK